MDDEAPFAEIEREPEKLSTQEAPVYICDRCGCQMVESNCKVMCLNCGNRFDCSDLTLYFD